MDDVVIRKMRESDINQVRDFYSKHDFHHVASIDEDYLRKCINTSLGEYITFIVAEFDDKIVGSVYVADLGSMVTIWGFVVDEKHRNRDIGTKLFEKVLGIAESKKRDVISLLVNPENRIALKFYEKFGFEKKSRYRMDKVA